MKIRTHIALSGALTVAIIGLIWYQSNKAGDERLKKVMESGVAVQKPAVSAANAKPSQAAPEKAEEAAPAPQEEQPVEKQEVVVSVPPKEAKDEPKKAAAAPERSTSPEDDDFPARSNIVKNGGFKNGLSAWRFWRLKEEEGKKFLKTDNGILYLNGQANTLMGVAQTVDLISGAVYRMSAKVRDMSPPAEGKNFLGARMALNAPGQKEHQIVWLYSSSDWKESEFVFTNAYTGKATLFFHTGYTTNSSNCAVKDIALILGNEFPGRNDCSSNGDFKDGLKGWNYWQISAEEGSNLVFRAEEGEPHVVIKGQAGKKLMGLSQAVNVVSGNVYKLSAVVKSQDLADRSFFGARVAIYAPGTKEKQLLWTYATKDWEKKELVFTNNFTGAATLYFHTGYTTNACVALFKELKLTKKR